MRPSFFFMPSKTNFSLICGVLKTKSLGDCFFLFAKQSPFFHNNTTNKILTSSSQNKKSKKKKSEAPEKACIKKRFVRDHRERADWQRRARGEKKECPLDTLQLFPKMADTGAQGHRVEDVGGTRIDDENEKSKCSTSANESDKECWCMSYNLCCFVCLAMLAPDEGHIRERIP